MARLKRGYEALHGTDDADDGSDTLSQMADSVGGEAGRKLRAQAANPNRTMPGEVRPGDRAALEQFKEKNALA